MKKILSMIDKNSVFNYMIYGNKLVVICVFFTFITVMDVVICTILKAATASPYSLLFDRLVLCAITLFPLNLFKHFEKLSMWAVFPIHFAACCALSLLYTYASGFFMELYTDAYYEMFRSVVTVYLVFVAGALIIELTRTFRANMDLKKIQNSIKKN